MLQSSYRLAEPRAAKPVIESKHQLRRMPTDLQLKVGSCRAGGNSICLCLTGVLLWPPGRKPWTAWVHFHHMYSTDHHELNHSRKRLLLLECIITSLWYYLQGWVEWRGEQQWRPQHSQLVSSRGCGTSGEPWSQQIWWNQSATN